MDQNSQLTKEQQTEIEELASLFFTDEEIVVIMQLPEDTLQRVNVDDFYLPFKRGRLKKEAELRKSIFNLAVNGSSPAQILATQIIKESELKNIPV
jgi:hypothetical protein